MEGQKLNQAMVPKNLIKRPMQQAVPVQAQMTEQRIIAALTTLQEYQKGKQQLEKRIVENEKWWRMQNINMQQAEGLKQKRSAWTTNSILNKHADAMDNYPEANVLPRAKDDEDSAKIISSVLPVVLQHNGFDKVWSDVWWNKLLAGVAAYGVFWNQKKVNGLGDVEIRAIEILNLFWEPGIRDIQMSRNLFHVEMQPNETLVGAYPKLRGKLGGQGFKLARYEMEDDAKANDPQKSLVVDWYYKKYQNGREVLHYCKFCNGTILYASEDDAATKEKGFYAHGKYPFVFDVLFPLKESPAGFGYVDIMKDAQENLDAIGAAIVKNARMRATKRFFIRTSGNVNEKEFADWNRELVHTEGALDESSVKEIKVDALGGDVMTAYASLIEEIKETSGNRDFSQGGTTSGVTAAAAIAALQEAGSKLSRDMLRQSYIYFTDVCYMALEVIREFYDLTRTFRIIGQDGATQYIPFNNAKIQPVEVTEFGETFQSVPVFDIDIKPQRNNPYSKVAQNELMLQFFKMGFFNPQMADMAVMCMKHMDFDGKQQLMADIQTNGTMFEKIQQMGAMLEWLARELMLNNPDMAAVIVKFLQGMGGGPQAAVMQGQGNAELPNTNSLGQVQKADDILTRKRNEVAGRSDPNGASA